MVQQNMTEKITPTYINIRINGKNDAKQPSERLPYTALIKKNLYTK
jgi:hypothetical protein